MDLPFNSTKFETSRTSIRLRIILSKYLAISSNDWLVLLKLKLLGLLITITVTCVKKVECRYPRKKVDKSTIQMELFYLLKELQNYGASRQQLSSV